MTQTPNTSGLTTTEAQKRREQFGPNILVPEKRETLFHKILHVILEPMFILLIIAALIYFILGEPRDGLIMLVFVLGIISIEIIQEWKTDRTLNALKDLSAPKITVIRDGKETIIPSSELVPGDLMVISEGVKIPADGTIVKVNDLCIDESSLTGEAEGVWKVLKDDSGDNDYWRKDYCYAGTLVINGSAHVVVDKIGAATEYGKIGKDIALAPEEETPLQKQTGKLVAFSAVIAAILFVLVAGITYFNLADHLFKARFTESILSGITLAMAMIPEEFPVILTVFLSMGAWRLAQKKSLVRRLPSVETLGAVSVLCVDKTGTITKNQMTVQDTWALDSDTNHLAKVMGLACETEPHDPMEKAMHQHCESLGLSKGHLFSGELLYEYPFTNETKMMGHVWNRDEEIMVAAKGSPEKILTLCQIPDHHREAATRKMAEMSEKGLRVIAIARMNISNKDAVPQNLSDCQLQLCGLVGLADPPRSSVKENIKECVSAGIRVVMITGDNGTTASAIARQVGIPNPDTVITGAELDALDDQTLQEKVKTASIFARVVPEHKMRIVKAFKANGAVVAMTGDGVNDAPALKYADIGIAMGKRGSEVSREAADLILLDDNFATIVKTIKDGRRIYDNIQKAIGYVFTIHIPIALASLLAPLLGIAPTSLLLLPLHVVLLELVIDPTCSIVLERQPAEANIMGREPRKPAEQIMTVQSLFKSIIQGLVIFAASFGSYNYFLRHDDATLARTIGIAIIILANMFLVVVNSSKTTSALQSIKMLEKDRVFWAITAATITGIIAILYSPLNHFLKLAPLTFSQLLLVLVSAFASVFWYEIVKIVLRKQISNRKESHEVPSV